MTRAYLAESALPDPPAPVLPATGEAAERVMRRFVHADESGVVDVLTGKVIDAEPGRGKACSKCGTMNADARLYPDWTCVECGHRHENPGAWA